VATATSIEWTEITWNPVRGCSRVSPGCEHCYAERMAHRFSGPGRPYEGLTRIGKRGEPRWSGKVVTASNLLEEPLRIRQPRMVFVNSMSDLFHDKVPLKYIQQVFAVMQQADWHSFQVLTKRPERCLEIASSLPWPHNVWLGVSIESAEYLHRLQTLRAIPSSIRFLSLEPLLGPLRTLNLSSIHWVIVGGESGPGARKLDISWVREIRESCLDQRVPFFFKQWGGTRKKAAGRVLDGRTWDEFPVQSIAAE